MNYNCGFRMLVASKKAIDHGSMDVKDASLLGWSASKIQTDVGHINYLKLKAVFIYANHTCYRFVQLHLEKLSKGFKFLETLHFSRIFDYYLNILAFWTIILHNFWLLSLFLPSFPQLTFII